MSWLFSQALVEAFSAASCSDGELSALSSGNPTPQAYLLPVKTTDAWSRFPSGITLSPLTESRGKDVLTWFLEGFPAKTSVQPEKALESTANGQECGEKWHGSLAKYDPDSSSWKTAQCLLLGGLEQFSETWPRWGLMRNGECWAVEVLEPLTLENESGFLPTPKKIDAFQARMKLENFKRPEGKKHNFSLSNCDEYFSNLYQKRFTPIASEMMMLWPYGWTDLQPVETVKYLQWLQKHGECLEGQ